MNTSTFQENLKEVLGNLYGPFFYALLTFFTLLVVYSKMVPSSIIQQSNTVLGRLFLVLALYLMVEKYGRVLGIVAALAIALLWAQATVVTEGFGSGGDVTTIEIPKDKANKWLVETVLGENPVAIKEKEVNTQAVQDNSRNSMSSGVGNSSVQ